MLVADIVAALRSYATGDGTTLPFESHVATARSPETPTTVVCLKT